MFEGPLKLGVIEYQGPEEDVEVAAGASATVEIPVSRSGIRNVKLVVGTGRIVNTIGGLRVDSIEFTKDKAILTVTNTGSNTATIPAGSISLAATAIGY